MAKAATKSNYNLSAKVTEKGGVSIYGMGRWPVTLYADQWEAIFENADKIKAFIKTNAKQMKPRPEGKGPADATAL